MFFWCPILKKKTNKQFPKHITHQHHSDSDLVQKKKVNSLPQRVKEKAPSRVPCGKHWTDKYGGKKKIRAVFISQLNQIKSTWWNHFFFLRMSNAFTCQGKFNFTPCAHIQLRIHNLCAVSEFTTVSISQLMTAISEQSSIDLLPKLTFRHKTCRKLNEMGNQT